MESEGDLSPQEKIQRAALKMLDEIEADSPEKLEQFYELAFQRPTYLSSDFAISLCESLLKRTNLPEKRAPLLCNLSTMLSFAKKHDRAIPHARDGVALFEALSNQDRQRFLPGLASALENFAAAASCLGQSQDALDAILQAERHQRELYSDGDPLNQLNLSSCLITLSIACQQNGDRERGLAAAQEAVLLTEGSSPGSNRDLSAMNAKAMIALSSRLAELADFDEAIEMATQASKTYDELCDIEPDRFEPDLASSLNVLANRHYNSGDMESAINTGERARTIYQRLLKSRGSEFLADHARCLNNLSIFLDSDDQRDAARQMAFEAVEVRKRLFEEDPRAHKASYAMSLNNFCAILHQDGHLSKALSAADTCHQLYFELYSENPAAYAPDFAMVKNTLAVLLNALGRASEAVSFAVDSSDMRRVLEEERPEVFAPDLANSLNTLAQTYLNVGDLDNACQASVSAILSIKSVYPERPAALGSLLGAIKTLHLSICLHKGISPDVALFEFPD